MIGKNTSGGLKVLDLFCGAGGFSEGFRQAGMEIVMGLDNNRSACNVFEYNFPKSYVAFSDINEYKYDVFKEGYFGDYPEVVDVVIGSPPCKEFSRGNVNRSWDMSLIDKFLEVIELLNPKYFVMENVPYVRDAINPLFSKYAKRFPSQMILRAYDYGCATNRKRLFAGNFPKNLEKSYIKRVVKDVINPDISGFQQPFKEGVYRKVDPNKPFITITSQRIGNERYLLPNGRSLEISELATIQGFPPWFIFPCSRTEAQRLIGNSVCPPVAKAIGEAIMKDWLEKNDEEV